MSGGIGLILKFLLDPKVLLVWGGIGLALIFLVPATLVALPFLLPLAPVFWFFCLRSLPPKVIPPRSKVVGPNTRRSVQVSNLKPTPVEGIYTLDGLFRNSAEKYAKLPCLGARKELGTIEKKKQITKNGKVEEKIWKIAKKSKQYHWQTYQEVYDEVRAFGCGLSKLNIEPDHPISIYAETSPFWQKAAQACFAYKFPLVTVYASLGEDALVYGFNQTETSAVLIDGKLAPMIFGICTKKLAPHLRTIVYDGKVKQEDVERFVKETEGTIAVYSYQQVCELGKERLAPKVTPQPGDIAVIMYTSGSTGNPKGVMISHCNMVGAVAGAADGIPNLGTNDRYIAFLPLAHVLELCAETCILATGGALGYSSPQSLSDDSVVDENEKPCGDLSALKPTVMASVPVILDRIRAGVMDKLSQSPLMKKIFDIAYYMKRRNWLAGKSSPILDALFFSKLRGRLGGSIRMMLSGGAPLSPDTQEFFNIAFCTPIGQGYGATETCGPAAMSDTSDPTTRNVGGPITCNDIRLVDCPEMGYTNNDVDEKTGAKVPRGEIWIGGHNITMGYFRMPDKTAEDFHVDENNVRWFKTGDIGKWNPDGTLSIIDRKKDLVKLSGGEYIALGNLEAILKIAPIVENVCVYGDSMHLTPVALVLPNRKQLSELAASVGVDSQDINVLCKHPEVVKAALAQLQGVLREKKLKNFEIVSAIKLVTDEWTPASGLLTEAMKLKRKEITTKYKADLDALYGKK